MGSHHPIRKTVAPEIPDKLYFRIGDVARLCEVPAYVLRFWETEFPQLKPNKGGTGQRLYRRRDVEMALRIKSLLYDQGYTIPGARQVFKAEPGKTPAVPDAKLSETRPAETRSEPRTFAMKPREPVLSLSPAIAPIAPTSANAAEPPLAAAALRAEKLQALRADLSALLQTLSKPAGAAAFATSLQGNVQAMRPRLTLEKPKPPFVSPRDEPFDKLF